MSLVLLSAVGAYDECAQCKTHTHERTNTHTHARTHTHTHARASARAHAHARTPTYTQTQAVGPVNSLLAADLFPSDARLCPRCLWTARWG